jgi:putative phosphoribosyl transferase
MDAILLLNRRRELHKQEGGAIMIFTNRTEAGQGLAWHLTRYANRPDVIVLGVPRGGVTVAFEVATALGAPLDVFVLRKLGVPGHEEVAFGAIGGGGVRVLNPDVTEGLGLSQLDIELVTAAEKQELKRRERAYRGGRNPLDVRGLTVILVDDGIATGSSVQAAIRALRQMNPARIVVATPVAPPSTCNRLRSDVDELVCVETPERFFGVGQFYRDFSQVSEEEVNDLLNRAARQFAAPLPDEAEVVPQRNTLTVPGRMSKRNGIKSEVSIEANHVLLGGTLNLPESRTGIVLFAHGSGSSRRSPRNRYVAQVLESQGIATLLFDDLLTRAARL